MANTYKLINKDRQILKFCFYGLLKNLKFFEPYLYIYLLSTGINLFQIGILFSIREIVTYIFEIPSGIFADNYGKKTTLLMCFIFYIISFILFFMGINFALLIIAMIFFGLGEAFRSGTHKAMIYSYLEKKDWFNHKTYVYGRTRSFSLIGSSISAFISIIFILNLPSTRWIFLMSTLPYIVDFVLVATYPNYLNEKQETDLSIKKFFITSFKALKNIFTSKSLTNILLSSSLYDGIFKTIKDYIQPILKSTILVVSAVALTNSQSEARVKVILGITYGIFYIFSSMSAKNVYKLNKFATSYKLMNLSFDIMGIISLGLFFVIKNNLTYIVIILFFILYILEDARRPLVIDVLGDYADKDKRATVLSVDSQLRSLSVVIFSPLFGYIADKFSISSLFLFIGGAIIIINNILRYFQTRNNHINTATTNQKL